VNAEVREEEPLVSATTTGNVPLPINIFSNKEDALGTVTLSLNDLRRVVKVGEPIAVIGTNKLILHRGNSRGNPLSFESGSEQPIALEVEIPSDTPPGIYEGKLLIQASQNAEPKETVIHLLVKPNFWQQLRWHIILLCTIDLALLVIWRRTVVKGQPTKALPRRKI
jgi:hypothetical protein